MTDFRQRLEQSRGNMETSDSHGIHGNGYFGINNMGSMPACLDLRLKQGIKKALPYASFAEIAFDTDIGITIFTPTKKITITGRDLSRLYDYLVQYRVRYIQTNLGGDTQEDGLFVGDIVIEEVG